MAVNKGVMFMLATLVLSSIVGISSATSYVVGGSTGWTIPTSSSFYSSWASQQNLLVGDILVFTFPAGGHTVAEVSKANYDSCTSAATLGPVMATAPANITLTKPGTHYFICTITGHCGANQKLTVTTSALAATPTPQPSPSSPKSSPIASPKSSPVASPKSSPIASPKSSPTPSPMPSPASSPTPTPAPSATSPAPTPVPDAPGSEATVPASASSPAGSSDGGSGSPPEGNFAASTSVSLLSLLPIVALALVF